MAQPQLYNNPAFASGLGDVLSSMLAPKDASPAAQYDAQRAGMLADTRNYRLGLGQAGEEGDYANMMIRALQAGNDYSNNAPEITSAITSLPGSGYSLAEQAGIQVGTGVQNAKGTIAYRSGGGSGGGGSNATFTAGNRNLLLSAFAEAGVDPNLSLTMFSQAENIMRDKGMSQAETMAYDANNMAMSEGAPATNPWPPFGIGSVDAIDPAVTGITPYSAGQIGQPGAVAPAPTDPSQRVIGTQYQAPNGNVATWTAQGWQS